MRVLVADPLAEAGVAALRERFDVDVRTGLARDELLGCIGDYAAVVVRSETHLDADVLAAGRSLKVVARAGIGLDNVDVAAATKRGVLVCNAPESNVVSAAEHTVALMLALARAVPQADRSLRAGRWERAAFQGVELHGKVLGILGLGRVGGLVAQRCNAFGMRLLAFDPYVSAERAAHMGVELVGTVSALCGAADMLTVHLPRTAETVGLVGEAELRAMKPTARVVNTARGGIVDEDALHAALTEGWIAGAALDVFVTEPPADRRLLELDNVVVTPHLGASTAEAQDKASTMAAEAVILALSDEFVPSAVNVQVGVGVSQAVRAFLPLAEKLGRLLVALHPGRASDVTVEYIGRIAEEDTQATTLGVLRGMLSEVVHEPVTFVNAPMLAEERGLSVSTLSTASSRDYVSLLRLHSGDVRVAGTLVGARDRERLVEVWGFDIDMEPTDHMAFFRYLDRPGIVGTIGSKLGAAGVNIAAMQVGRRRAGADQVIVMAVDSPVPPEVVDDIARAIDAHDVRYLDFTD